MGFAWEIYLFLLLPLPLGSVILLTTCGRWSFVRRACRGASGLKFRIGSKSSLSLRAICSSIATVVFIVCFKASWDAHTLVLDMDPHSMTPDRKIQLLAKKWRNERNFWISALVLLLWYVLGGLMRLQDENAELRMQSLAYSTAFEIERNELKKRTGDAEPTEIEMAITKKDK